jgi:hypothetical protein
VTRRRFRPHSAQRGYLNEEVRQQAQGPRQITVDRPHLSRPSRGVSGRAAVTLVVAGQVGPPDTALRHPGVPVARLFDREHRCVLCDPEHWPLSAHDLRLHRWRAAVDLAGAVLRLRRARHGPVPTVHPRGRAGLLGSPRSWLIPQSFRVDSCW